MMKKNYFDAIIYIKKKKSTSTKTKEFYIFSFLFVCGRYLSAVSETLPVIVADETPFSKVFPAVRMSVLLHFFFNIPTIC